jgi:hypothetical protein
MIYLHLGKKERGDLLSKHLKLGLRKTRQRICVGPKIVLFQKTSPFIIELINEIITISRAKE